MCQLLNHYRDCLLGFPGGPAVKNLPAMQETQEMLVWSLGREDPLEEGMAAHPSIVWRIPWTEEPGTLQSMGLQRVGHDWAIKHSTSFRWKWKWQPTPAFLLGKSHGQRRLAGYSCKESDMTEQLSTHTHSFRSSYFERVRLSSSVVSVIKNFVEVLKHWVWNLLAHLHFRFVLRY